MEESRTELHRGSKNHVRMERRYELSIKYEEDKKRVEESGGMEEAKE